MSLKLLTVIKTIVIRTMKVIRLMNAENMVALVGRMNDEGVTKDDIIQVIPREGSYILLYEKEVDND